MDDRLRIPQDGAYFQAVGLATVAFARLEWNVVWCCERLQPGYIRTIEPLKKTAGTIGRDVKSIFSLVADPELRSKIEPFSEEFRDVVKLRNGLMHANPATSKNGEQRLFRYGFEWTIDEVNKFSDRCTVASVPFNDLLYNEFKKPCGVTLLPAA